MCPSLIILITLDGTLNPPALCETMSGLTHTVAKLCLLNMGRFHKIMGLVLSLLHIIYEFCKHRIVYVL